MTFNHLFQYHERNLNNGSLFLSGLKNDIDDAEKTLKNVQAGEALRSAIRRRHLGDLEKSMADIRKNGWEKDWGIELKEGEKLAKRLRRLEKLKAEIMELKQSVISEIRSYQNPPPAVHKVCKGNFKTTVPLRTKQTSNMHS